MILLKLERIVDIMASSPIRYSYWASGFQLTGYTSANIPICIRLLAVKPNICCVKLSQYPKYHCDFFSRRQPSLIAGMMMTYPEGEGNATLYNYYDDGGGGPGPGPSVEPIDIDTENKIISLNYLGFPQVSIDIER